MYETSAFDLIIGFMYFGFLVIIFIVNYVTGTVGTLKLAKEINYNHKWLSFIPGLRLLIFNKLMNPNMRGIFKNKLNFWLLLFPFLIFLGLFLSSICLGLMGDSGGPSLLFLLIFIICLLCVYVWMGIYFYAIFEFYYKYSSKNFIMWFVLSFFFGSIVHSISMIILSKNINTLKTFNDNKDEIQFTSNENQTINISKLDIKKEDIPPANYEFGFKKIEHKDD